MKAIAIGDVFITPEMMEKGIEGFSDLIDSVEYFFFGENDKELMRATVKTIERGGKDELDIPEGLMDAVGDAELIMCHLCPITKELLDRAEHLKYILCNRGGYENIDIEVAHAHGVKILLNPAHNANAVADFTIGLILCETRNICRSNMAVRNGVWREQFPNTGTIRELKDLTIGVIGFGSVAELVCEKLRGFNCKILINRKREPDYSNNKIAWDRAEFVSLDKLLAESDVVTLHARSDKQIMGKEEFAKMKKTAYFINTSRPKMVDYEALVEALKKNLIGGAALDVFHSEPLGAGDDFLELDNVTLTNHRGGDTLESYADSPAMMLEWLKNYIICGKEPKYCI